MNNLPYEVLQLEIAISKASSIPVSEIRSRNRESAVCDARFAVWAVLHDAYGYPYMAIARMYGRDHTTVMSGIRRIRESEAAEALMKRFQKRAGSGTSRRISGWKW